MAVTEPVPQGHEVAVFTFPVKFSQLARDVDKIKTTSGMKTNEVKMSAVPGYKFFSEECTEDKLKAMPPEDKKKVGAFLTETAPLIIDRAKLQIDTMLKSDPPKTDAEKMARIHDLLSIGGDLNQARGASAVGTLMTLQGDPTLDMKRVGGIASSYQDGQKRTSELLEERIKRAVQLTYESISGNNDRSIVPDSLKPERVEYHETGTALIRRIIRTVTDHDNWRLVQSTDDKELFGLSLVHQFQDILKTLPVSNFKLDRDLFHAMSAFLYVPAIEKETYGEKKPRREIAELKDTIQNIAMRNAWGERWNW